MDDERSELLENYVIAGAEDVIITIPGDGPPAQHRYNFLEMKQFREHMTEGGSWEIMCTRWVRRIWLGRGDQ